MIRVNVGHGWRRESSGSVCRITPCHKLSIYASIILPSFQYLTCCDTFATLLIKKQFNTKLSGWFNVKLLFMSHWVGFFMLGGLTMGLIRAWDPWDYTEVIRGGQVDQPESKNKNFNSLVY